MEDKVIHEVRVIETDTGYRIEINGDKEKIRRTGLMQMAMGRRGRRWLKRGRGAWKHAQSKEESA